MLKCAAIAIAVLILLLTRQPTPGTAIPIFSHQYDVACSKCHTVIPHLNEFGNAFMVNGYRIPGVKPGPAFPISVKANLLDSSENQGAGPDGAGLPKAIVDEVEIFTAGGIGDRVELSGRAVCGRRRRARAAARRVGDRPPQSLGREDPAAGASRLVHATAAGRSRNVP